MEDKLGRKKSWCTFTDFGPWDWCYLHKHTYLKKETQECISFCHTSKIVGHDYSLNTVLEQGDKHTKKSGDFWS